MIDYLFTDDEWDIIDEVADLRAQHGRDGYKPGFENLSLEWSWQIGTAGEAAVSRHFGLPFYRGADYKPGHDVGPYEVRSRPQRSQDLALKDYEFTRFNPHQKFILCWVTRPCVTIVGWTTVHTVKTKGKPYKQHQLTFLPWEWHQPIDNIEL